MLITRWDEDMRCFLFEHSWRWVPRINVFIRPSLVGSVSIEIPRWRFRLAYCDRWYSTAERLLTQDEVEQL